MLPSKYDIGFFDLGQATTGRTGSTFPAGPFTILTAIRGPLWQWRVFTRRGSFGCPLWDKAGGGSYLLRSPVPRSQRSQREAMANRMQPSGRARREKG